MKRIVLLVVLCISIVSFSLAQTNNVNLKEDQPARAFKKLLKIGKLIPTNIRYHKKVGQYDIFLGTVGPFFRWQVFFALSHGNTVTAFTHMVNIGKFTTTTAVYNQDQREFQKIDISEKHLGLILLHFNNHEAFSPQEKSLLFSHNWESSYPVKGKTNTIAFQGKIEKDVYYFGIQKNKEINLFLYKKKGREFKSGTFVLENENYQALSKPSWQGLGEVLMVFSQVISLQGLEE